MKYKGIQIENTFAEAFNMKASRIIVTADNLKWAKNACDSFTGFATSVIACGIEAGIGSRWCGFHCITIETLRTSHLYHPFFYWIGFDSIRFAIECVVDG